MSHDGGSNLSARLKTVVEAREMTPRRYVCIRFDDGVQVTVPRKVAENAGAAPGMTLLPATIDVLREAEARAAELLAIRRLGTSDRTEKELRDYLAARGFSAEAIQNALQPLVAGRMVDDLRTADQHVSVRGRSQPRSRRMLRAELMQRGVAPGAAEEAVDEVDDEANARHLVERRLARAPRDSFRNFELHLGPYLMRRGFGYDTASRVIQEKWNEIHPDGQDQ